MFNAFSRKWYIGCIIGGLLLSSAICCHSQPRVSGAFGASLDLKLVGEARAGWDIGKLSVDYGLLHSVPKGLAFHGPSLGWMIQSKDSKIIPFVGYSRVEFGRKTSVDRYVKDGDTTIIFSNLKQNTWSVPFGIKVIREHFYFSTGMTTGKYTTFYATVGISHIF